MIKYLSKDEVSKMLIEESDSVPLYVRNNKTEEWKLRDIISVIYHQKYNYPFLASEKDEDLFYLYCGIEVPDEYESYPDDEVPNLKRLDGVLNKSKGIEETVLSVDRDKEESRHICLSEFSWKTNKDLFEEYTHLDCTPIGKVKQNKTNKTLENLYLFQIIIVLLTRTYKEVF